MSNRLPYETKGGQLSEAETFAQLLEYLRMAEECCYMLGHLRKANSDLVSGEGWMAVGQTLDRTQKLVQNLATGGTGKVGWRQ